MTTEDYVSFEIAKLLKEKGFDVYGDGSYGTATEIHREYSPVGKIRDCSTSMPARTGYPAPTLQMTMKWLREVHHYYIQVMIDNWVGVHVGYYVIIMKTDSDFGFELYDEVEQVFYETPEEAYEAAIKYCLKNHI